MYNEKLSQLADFLAHDVKDEGFHYAKWILKFDELTICNTVACAFGWAPMCFGKSSGLKIHSGSSLDGAYIVYTDENGHDHSGVYAAATFFDVNLNEAHYLFIDLPNSTPRLAVAEHIKEFALTGVMRS